MRGINYLFPAFWLSGSQDTGGFQVAMNIVQMYKRIARWYDYARLLWTCTISGRAEKLLDELLFQHFPVNGRVLDMGCGTAANLGRLIRLDLKFEKYIGLDLSGEMIKQAIAKFRGIDGVEFCRGDARRPPFSEGCFDMVLSTWMLSHIPIPKEVIEAALTLVKKDGHLLLLFWSRMSFTINPARPIERIFRMRVIKHEDYAIFPNQVLCKQFKGGLVTLMLLRKK